MIRKLLTSLLMILMITVQPVIFPSADTENEMLTDGIFTYYIKEENAVLVSCSDTECTSITIPAKLGDYPLTEIEGGAFSLCTKLKSFESRNRLFEVHQNILYKEGTLICYPPARNMKVYDAPSFVTAIADCAFFGNTSLTTVKLNDNITVIPSEGFAGCTSLYTVSLSENTTEIKDGAFAFCSSLKKITLPDSLTKIGNAAFYGCGTIQNLNLGDNLVSIGDTAFKDCISLKEIRIPEKITDIDGWIFSVNSGLEKISVSEDNQRFTVADNILYTKDMETLVFCPAGSGITSLDVPDKTYIIGRNSFENHKTLKEITLSDSVTEIADRAFYGAHKLTSVNFGKDTSKIGEYAFYGCGYLKDITITEAVTEIGTGAFDDCISLTLYIADGSAVHEYAVKNNVNHRIDPNQAAVPRERWSQKYIDWAEANGITEGVEDYTVTINQEGFCWLIMNYYEKVAKKEEAPIPENPFSDTSSPAVLKAYGLGFAQGLYENTFAPARPITRQEICVNLFHLITALNGEEPERGELQTFRDSEEIAVWAVSYISIAYNNSIISGLPDGRINPTGHATIEEALGMLYNASLLIR